MNKEAFLEYFGNIVKKDSLVEKSGVFEFTLVEHSVYSSTVGNYVKTVKVKVADADRVSKEIGNYEDGAYIGDADGALVHHYCEAIPR